MKRRQLFYAKKDDEMVNVDKLTSKEGVFLCPYCHQQVIPKQGEKNVWHFAHKENPCRESYPQLDDGQNDKLAGFIVATKNEIEVPTDPTYFMCSRCYKKERKESGIRWDEKEFICKDCFRLL